MRQLLTFLSRVSVRNCHIILEAFKIWQIILLLGVNTAWLKIWKEKCASSVYAAEKETADVWLSFRLIIPDFAGVNKAVQCSLCNIFS